VDALQLRAILEEGTHCRGWITNSYAQIEFLLGDLIVRSRWFHEYSEHNSTISHSATRRVAKVRAMLKITGALTPYTERLGAILNAFELTHDTRNLLAHGYCQLHYTPDGDAGLVFQKFDREAATMTNNDGARIQRTFRLADLRQQRDESVALAQQALMTFTTVASELGWAD